MKIMQVRNNTEDIFKYLAFILLLFFIQAAILVDSHVVEKSVYAYQKQIESAEILVIDKPENDPVIDLLSKNFNEIKQALGEPAEQGNGSWLGAHHNILYQYEEGFIHFFLRSPLRIRLPLALFYDRDKKF